MIWNMVAYSGSTVRWEVFFCFVEFLQNLGPCIGSPFWKRWKQLFDIQSSSRYVARCRIRSILEKYRTACPCPKCGTVCIAPGTVKSGYLGHFRGDTSRRLPVTAGRRVTADCIPGVSWVVIPVLVFPFFRYPPFFFLTAEKTIACCAVRKSMLEPYRAVKAHEKRTKFTFSKLVWNHVSYFGFS